MAIPTYVQKPLCSKILFLKFIFSHCVIYLVYFVLLRPLMAALSLLILSTFNSISIYNFFHTFCVIPTVLYQQHFSNEKAYACARALALIIIKYGKMQCCTDSITDTIPACTSICTNSLFPLVMSFSYIRHISINTIVWHHLCNIIIVLNAE